MKTIIVSREDKDLDADIAVWIASTYLQSLGSEPIFYELESGEDFSFDYYYDIVAAYMIGDCLSSNNLKYLISSKHIVHSISTSLNTLTVLDETLPVKLYPVPRSLSNRLYIKLDLTSTLSKLAWEYFRQSPTPDFINNLDATARLVERVGVSHLLYQQLLEEGIPNSKDDYNEVIKLSEINNEFERRGL